MECKSRGLLSQCHAVHKARGIMPSLPRLKPVLLVPSLPRLKSALLVSSLQCLKPAA